MKKVSFFIIGFAVLAAVTACTYLPVHKTEASYQSAVRYLREGQCGKAEAALVAANPEKDIRENMQRLYLHGQETSVRYYKDSQYLYVYGQAMLAHTLGNTERSKKWLDMLPISYTGDLCMEMRVFRKAVYKEYAADGAREQAKMSVREEKNRLFLEQLKQGIPYEGMSELYIHATAVGNPGKKESAYTKETGLQSTYYWYADNGRDIPLIVRCTDCKVTSVERYYLSVYWSADGMPRFHSTAPQPTPTPTPRPTAAPAPKKAPYSAPKSSKAKPKSDPYDVYDYDNAEDFYDDNYADFWCYEDAEEYYNDHNG